MIESKKSDYRTIGLFLAISLVIILVYIGIFEIIQLIEISSGGLVHRTLILNALLLVGAVMGVLVMHAGLRANDLGLIGRKVPLALVACLLTWVLVQTLEALAGFIINGNMEFDTRWNTEAPGLVGLLIGMLFGTALYEEIGYRGFLLVQFDMKMSGVTSIRYLQTALALLISQTFFTLMHVPWKVMNQGWTIDIVPDLIFSVFMNGLIYGILYLRTENLFFVMGVHALGNAPTSLFASSIGASNLVLLLAIIWAIVWPKLKKWEKEDTVSDNQSETGIEQS